MFVEHFTNSLQESFFEKELPFLAEQFEEIVIIPLYERQDTLLYKHEKVRVELFDFFAPVNRLKVVASNLFLITYVFVYEFVKTHHKIFYIKNFFSLLNTITLRIGTADNLKKSLIIDKANNALFYTYWFNQAGLTLAIFKRKFSKIKWVSRVHGGDYDEEQTKRPIPFRFFALSQVNKVFPVSDYGSNYLKKYFNVDINKLSTAHLGLDIRPQLGPIDPTRLHIVSCSSVIALKRVSLIVEILKSITSEVKWTHFGHGDQFEALKRSSNGLPKNVSYELKGYVPNNEFVSYLASEPISFFINVSESEGIPVSMMEAISRGIPLIGTNVCGVPEIVNNYTGILIPINFEPKKVAELICSRQDDGKIYSVEFRKGIIDFYSNNFNDQKNYTEFSRSLSEICLS